MLKDTNGIELKAGEIVEITRAFFKTDIGLYFVACGTDYPNGCYRNSISLHKITTKGKLVTRNSVAFWPLVSFTNSRLKRAEAKTWNEENAVIIHRPDVDNTAVLEYFREEIEKQKMTVEYWSARGWATNVKEASDLIAYYERAIKNSENQRTEEG